MIFRPLATAQTGTLRSILARRSALSTTAVRRSEQSPVLAPKRPVGAFRGGIIGFLLGLTFTGGYAYLNLLEEYQSASNLLLLSVEELKGSTTKLVGHIKRIEDVEKQVNQLKSKSTTQEEIEKLRGQVQALHESSTIELLGVKSHLLGVEQDVQQLIKGESASNV